DGVTLLTELGALNTGNPDRVRGRGGRWVTRTFTAGTITPLGRRLARLPLAPRLARMILAAQQHKVVPEMLVSTAGFTIAAPRKRRGEQRAAADERRCTFTDDVSDCARRLRLWKYRHHEQREVCGHRVRKLCRRELIS